MAKKKIFNDPVYGLVSFKYEILYDIIDHRYFQRLRRITQLGLTHYVYPGALHTRFHHAIGALHLMTMALQVLSEKGIEISEEEEQGVCLAILLHDVGHGPYSHALEHHIINVHHEDLSLWFMEKLNDEFDGKLSLAIEIFKDNYHKKFLHELVSSQLDMDRMDYLIRDSYYTGVAEGVIGYDRIIKMLNVANGHLVVEEKGVYSIEKFLVARRLMYWQVYLHKTVLSAEQMLIKLLRRVKKLLLENVKVFLPDNVKELLLVDFESVDKELIINRYLDLYAQIDDVDILYLIKQNIDSEDYLLSYMCKSLLERKLFKIYLHSEKPSQELVSKYIDLTENGLKINTLTAKNLILVGQESNQTYNTNKDEIRILQKNGNVLSLSEHSLEFLKLDEVTKYFICFPLKPFS